MAGIYVSTRTQLGILSGGAVPRSLTPPGPAVAGPTKSQQITDVGAVDRLSSMNISGAPIGDHLDLRV